ncbi:MAG: PLP-dependent aminotransferase family protein [Steroidobacteraceae bacterium]
MAVIRSEPRQDMFQIARSSPKPLGDQLVEEVGRLIDDGRLAEACRLPSVRALSRRLGVSVYTVTTAFERLQARGLIESRPGSGHFVARRRVLAAAAKVELGSAPDEDPALRFTRSTLDRQDISVPAGAGLLPAQWLEEAITPAILARFARSGAAMLPASAQGDPMLRELLADRLHRAGIPAAPRNVLITYGASHAFDLIARRLLAPGDTVLVDDPGYFVLLTQLRAHRLKLVPVPKADDGSDLSILEDMARLHRPRMFFTQTLLHNPTGLTASASNCHGILTLAERYDFLVAEDHVYTDFGAPHLVSAAQIDELRRVIYVGSFTKMLNPAIRLGFLAASDSLVPPLVDEKVLSVLTGSAIGEFVVREVLASGKYRRHVDRIRERLAKARALATGLLNDAGVAVRDPPHGGLFLWARLPAGIDAGILAADARRAGILLAPGSMFSLTERGNGYLRFNAVYASDPRLLQFLAQRCRLAV